MDGIFCFRSINATDISLHAAEDILKSGHAVWPAPDGSGLIYATFDDSKVEEAAFEVHEDVSGGGGGLYPKLEKIRYPKVRENRVRRRASNLISRLNSFKAGSVNPSVTLWLVELGGDLSDLKSVRLKPPATFASHE